MWGSEPVVWGSEPLCGVRRSVLQIMGFGGQKCGAHGRRALPPSSRDHRTGGIHQQFVLYAVVEYLTINIIPDTTFSLNNF